MSTYGSSLVLMRRYGFLWVLMDCNRSLRVLIDPYESL